MKRAPFLEMTASRTSLDGAKRISTYCGCILKLIVLIIYSILYLRRRWSTFEQQMRREECKRNRGEGKVASAVLGDDTGIVAPGNTGIVPWLDFLPTSAFSPAPYLQLKWWSSWASTVHTHARSLSHFGNARILFTVWTHARSPTKPHGRKKQKGHTWVEISYKDGIVGVNAGGEVITIVNKDVENSEQKSCCSPAPIFVYTEFCGKRCSCWIYGQQVDVWNFKHTFWNKTLRTEEREDWPPLEI